MEDLLVEGRIVVSPVGVLIAIKEALEVRYFDSDLHIIILLSQVVTSHFRSDHRDVDSHCILSMQYDLQHIMVIN
jgi:hypothetical protein